MKHDKTKTIRIVAIASAILLLAGGVTVIATGSAPRVIDSMDTYLAATMETSVLLTDSASGAPVTPHEHAPNGSALAAVAFRFEPQTLMESFSFIERPLTLEPLHASRGGCPHPYGLIQGQCWFDPWHGTPCALPADRAVGEAAGQSPQCQAHKAQYGSIPPYQNTGYPEPLPPRASNPDLCDPQTPSTYCTSGGGPISDAVTGCSSGRCNLAISVRVTAAAKNLAEDIQLTVSASTRSASAALRPQDKGTLRLPIEGGATDRLVFEWRDVPARDLAGLTFVLGASARSTDLQGRAVTQEATTNIQPVLPDGELRISLSPASMSGVGYRDADRVQWAERLMPRTVPVAMVD